MKRSCPDKLPHSATNGNCNCIPPLVRSASPVVFFPLTRNSLDLAERQALNRRIGQRLLDPGEAIRHGFDPTEVVKEFGAQAAAMAYWAAEGEIA